MILASTITATQTSLATTSVQSLKKQRERESCERDTEDKRIDCTPAGRCMVASVVARKRAMSTRSRLLYPNAHWRHDFASVL